MSEIVVVDYDPSWPDLFASIRATLLPALEGVAIAIEHVGSTSVPGLAAKPVIDLDVVVKDGDVPRGIDRLRSIGYRHRGDCGVPDREAFRPPDGVARHHLYLCPASSVALWNHRAVRDHLRAHPSEARDYGELKRRLARTHANDSDGYVRAKTEFLVSLLRRCGASDAILRQVASANLGPMRAD